MSTFFVVGTGGGGTPAGRVSAVKKIEKLVQEETFGILPSINAKCVTDGSADVKMDKGEAPGWKVE